MRVQSGTFSVTKSLTITAGTSQGNTTDILMFWVPGAGSLNSATLNQSMLGLKAIPFSAWTANATDSMMTAFQAEGIDIASYDFINTNGTAFGAGYAVVNEGFLGGTFVSPQATTKFPGWNSTAPGFGGGVNNTLVKDIRVVSAGI